MYSEEKKWDSRNFEKKKNKSKIYNNVIFYTVLLSQE